MRLSIASFAHCSIQLPLPVKLRCRVDFSFAPPPDAKECAEWHGCVVSATSALGHVKWRVESLFCAVPGADVAMRRRVWEWLWRSKTNVPAPSDEMYGEAVRRLDCSRARTTHLLRTLLREFVVHWSSDDVVALIVFLPPRYHLLLEMRVESGECTATVKTDFWPVLAHLDDFFDRTFAGALASRNE